MANQPACRWPLLSELRGKIIFVLTVGFTQFRIGSASRDASGAAWTHWLIGDGGHPSKAECRTGTTGITRCSFPHGPDGNARRYGWAGGWGG